MSLVDILFALNLELNTVCLKFSCYQKMLISFLNQQKMKQNPD